MKAPSFFFFLMAVLFTTGACTAQTKTMKHAQIEHIIQTYVDGGDQNKSSVFAAHLSPDFRVAFNNTAEKKLSMLDKTTYSTLIDNKTFGGDKREVKILSIQVHGDLTATVQAELAGEKGTFYNLFSLAKVDGTWLLIEDLVYMIPKSS